MVKKNIAITIRSFEADRSNLEKLSSHFTITYLNKTGKRLSSDDLISALDDTQGVIAGTEMFTRNVLMKAPNLQVISRVGVGVDNIDGVCAYERGIKVLNTPLAPANAVAEHTLALILCCLKNICQFNTASRDETLLTGITTGLMLREKVCGVVGMGRIGRKTAALLLTFGCRVIYFDPYVTDKPNPDMIRADTLEELLGASDILTLHTPPLEGGEQIISRRTLHLCKDGVIIINTSRGTLLDENVLLMGLREKKIRALGLDVFAKEPYHGPLEAFPQVIMTPHVASNTVESRIEMEAEATDNLIKALLGANP